MIVPLKVTHYRSKALFPLHTLTFWSTKEPLLLFPTYGKRVSALPSTLLTPFQERGKLI